jgi:hypothetical protein
MKNLLSIKYWTNMSPDVPNTKALIIFTIFIVSLAVFSLVFHILRKKNKGIYFKIFRRLTSFCFSNFIIGLFLLFFVYESVYFLSGRFWFLFWGIGLIIWAGFIVKSFLEIPKIKEERQKIYEYKKYIP